MPADTLVILLVWVFYAIECVAWDSPDVVYFRSLFGRRWKIVRPSRLLENTLAGLAPLFPVPPLGAQLRVHPPRISFSPEGIAVYVPESGDLPEAPGRAPDHYLYDEIADVKAAGDEVVIDGKPFVRAFSKNEAVRLADIVRRIKKSRTKDRQKLVEEFVAGLFDRARIEAAVEDFLVRTDLVLLVGNLLWLCLIIGTPVFLYLYGFSRTVVPMLGLVLALHLAATGLTLRAHRAIYGKPDYSILYALLPSPFHSIRATDLLAKKLLSPFHPFAAAAALLTRDRFEAYARQSLALIRHPVYDGSRPARFKEIDQWYKGRVIRAMEEAVKVKGIDLASLDQPETSGRDTGYVSFCPRCHGLYQVEAGVCADCPDMTLVRLRHEPEIAVESLRPS